MRWTLVNDHPQAGGVKWTSRGARVPCSQPVPAIMAAGLGGDYISTWFLERDDGDDVSDPYPDKPPYRVPTMAEIAAVPKDGPTHVSTFSGTGGSCAGLALAGFRTLWANDCDPAAQACYRLNFPDVILDGRPIQRLRGADILKATGLAAGELDVLEGSPPCTAFSTAGRRDRGWRETKEHAGVVQQAVEDLFFEWLRLLEELRPRAFLAENVAGLARGRAKGMHLEILARMKAAGYAVGARIVDAQWLGVPQTRSRLIYLGLRKDLAVTTAGPRFPDPLPYRYSVRDALPHLYAFRFDTGGQFGKREECIDAPSPAIVGAGPQAGRNAGHYQVAEVELQVTGAHAGRRTKWSGAAKPVPAITASERGRGNVRIQAGGKPSSDRDGEAPSPAVCAGRTVEVRVQAGGARDDWRDGGRPSPAVIASGDAALVEIDASDGGPRASSPCGRETGSPDVVRRKLTIPEVMALCAFPPDFRLTGSFAQQWARLGNSVPPVMAAALGRALRTALEEAR